MTDVCKLLCIRNKSGCLLFDSFVRILIFIDCTYFAPQFAHAPPTAANFPVASPSYSELSFGIKKRLEFLPFRRYKCLEIGAS